MPELDGLEATKQLRDNGYRGVIIAVSATFSSELTQSWIEAGCNEFLQKPFHRHELISLILRHTMPVEISVS